MWRFSHGLGLGLFLVLIFPTRGYSRPKNNPSVRKPAAVQIVKVIADVGFVDPKYGSSVLTDLGETSTRGLRNLSLKTRDGVELLGRRERKPMDVTVYVPRDLNPKETRAFMREVSERLHARFGGRVFVKLKRSYMSGKTSRAPILYRPESRDLMAASVIGAGKSLLGVGYWLNTTGWNLYGLTQVTLSVLQDQFFHRFGSPFNEWKGAHNFPLFKRSWPVRFYNNRPLLKTMTINQLVALLSNGSFRMLSHLAHPNSVQSPFSAEFLASFGFLGLFGTPIGAAGDMAPNLLLKKGYISERVRHYLVNLYALEYQINSLLFQGDMTKYLFLYGIPLEWGGKLIAWTVAKALPPKMNRLFIFHPRIRDEDRDQIAYTRAFRTIYLTRDKLQKSKLKDITRKFGLNYVTCETALKNTKR